MDDATEAMEDQQEVQEALSAGFGNPFGIDEDDIMEELAGLEEEALDEDLIGLPNPIEQGEPNPIEQGVQPHPQPQPVDEEDQELDHPAETVASDHDDECHRQQT